MKFIAKTLEGLETVLAAELEQIGAQNIEIWKRAVAYTGDKVTLYKSNLLLRTCIKVLVFMQEFQIKTEKDLYNEIKKVAWEDYLSPDDTFAIDSVVNSTIFRHSNYIALKAKDAIADRFREKYNKRPDVNTSFPTLKLNIHIREDIVTLSLDSSGQSLHMRGYRKESVDAPLNEVLAAGIILLSEWDKKSPLIDPMCGSGTILCEAARIAAHVPPHTSEHPFVFKNWKSFDEDLWQDVCKESIEKISFADMPTLTGYDINPKAVHASISNISAAGLENYIKIEQEDFFYLEGSTNSTLIFNPPYDGRLKEEDVMLFYKHIGDKLKLSFSDCTAWILSGHLTAIKNLGLRPSSKKQLLNGSIPSLLCKFEMYSGSKKQKWNTLYASENESKHDTL